MAGLVESYRIKVLGFQCHYSTLVVASETRAGVNAGMVSYVCFPNAALILQGCDMSL